MTKKILFVENDKNFLDMMTCYLTWSGFDIIPLYSSKNLEEKIKELSVDVLICDYQIDSINGFALAERISMNQKDSQKTPILLIGNEYVSIDNYTLMRRRNIHFMTKYQAIGKWIHEINNLLNIKL